MPCSRDHPRTPLAFPQSAPATGKVVQEQRAVLRLVDLLAAVAWSAWGALKPRGQDAARNAVIAGAPASTFESDQVEFKTVGRSMSDALVDLAEASA